MLKSKRNFTILLQRVAKYVLFKSSQICGSSKIYDFIFPMSRDGTAIGCGLPWLMERRKDKNEREERVR